MHKEVTFGTLYTGEEAAWRCQAAPRFDEQHSDGQPLGAAGQGAEGNYGENEETGWVACVSVLVILLDCEMFDVFVCSDCVQKWKDSKLHANFVAFAACVDGISSLSISVPFIFIIYSTWMFIGIDTGDGQEMFDELHSSPQRFLDSLQDEQLKNDVMGEWCVICEWLK